MPKFEKQTHLTQVDPVHAEFLKRHGATETAHSGLTLWAHLKGVHDILANWGAMRHLQVAGLFHSIYGTRSFIKTTVFKTQRDDVIKLIGEPAETLVWSFSHLPRPLLFESSLKTGNFSWPFFNDKQNPEEIKILQNELLSLECANLIEQRIIYQFPQLGQHSQSIGLLNKKGFPT
jgi:hypothetical protein